MRILAFVFALFLLAGTSYISGASAGMVMTHGYVSLEDIKIALVKIINKLEKLESRLNKLERSHTPVLGIIRKNGTRVRLGNWGKPVFTLKKGTKVVIFAEDGEFFVTNMGYIHKSLVEVRYGK